MFSLSALFLAIVVYLLYTDLFTKGAVFVAGLAGFCIWRTADIYVTKITFSNERIIAQSLFFREISEPYSNITQIRFRFGSMIIDFSSGQQVKIRGGLGKAAIYWSYLEKYRPHSVSPRDASRGLFRTRN